MLPIRRSDALVVFKRLVGNETPIGPVRVYKYISSAVAVSRQATNHLRSHYGGRSVAKEPR